MRNYTLQEFCQAADREADGKKNIKVNGKWLECRAFLANPEDSNMTFQFYYDENKIDWTEAKALLDN